MSGPVLVELCAGTAALSLWALGRRRPLVGYMGSKRRWASQLSDAIGPVSGAVLVDAGPWGDVWTVLSTQEGRAEAAAVLDAWEQLGDGVALWNRLVQDPPYEDGPTRSAQYLWLQARAAGSIPVWWSEEQGRWLSPSGSKRNHATGGVCGLATRGKGGKVGAAPQKMSPGPGACRGIGHPATVARRLRRLDVLPWDRIEVVHADCRHLPPRAGCVVFLDPPYVGCPRYAELLPRADVLQLAQGWHEAGSRVLVSEAEPLELPGWTHRRLPNVKPEVVTANWPIRIAEQLDMFRGEAVAVGGAS